MSSLEVTGHTVLVVRLETVVSTALDVESGKIQAGLRDGLFLKEMVGDFARHELILVFHGGGHEASHHLVDHVVLEKHVGVEETVTEADVGVHLLELVRHTSQHGTDQGMAKSEGSRGEFIEDGRIAGVVVVIIVPFLAHAETIQVHGVESDDAWKELVVSDMLVDGAHDPTTLLVQSLVAPVRIHRL